MLTSSVLEKSLQELEHSDWGEPTYDSHLVTTIHRLRRVPLRQYTVEDLRIMIGQNIGLQYLIPSHSNICARVRLPKATFIQAIY